MAPLAMSPPQAMQHQQRPLRTVSPIATASLLDSEDDDNDHVEIVRTHTSAKVTTGGCCHLKEQSLWDQLTERFVHSLCGSSSSSTAGVPDLPQLLQADIFALLQGGISWETPWKKLLGWNATHEDSAAAVGPQRTTLAARAARIRKFRQETATVLRSRSLDVRRPSPCVYNDGDDDGYDSDPEDVVTLHTPKMLPTSASSMSSPSFSLTAVAPALIPQVVQETLNSSWTVRWHKVGAQQDPVSVTVWIERGTLVQRPRGIALLEPCLQWRRVQTMDGRRNSVRLLNICRITTDVDRQLYPWARCTTDNCCVLRTAAEDDEIVFECANRTVRDELVHRWKYVVARFAMLAVMEDMKTIQKEFLRPQPGTQTLVPDYEKELEDFL